MVSKKTLLIQFALILFVSNISAQTKIVIGVAYANQSADCSVFTSAVGYRFLVQKGKGSSLGEMRALVSEEIKKAYNISGSNIIFSTTDQHSNAVLVSYKKKLTGWNCYKFSYAVGFGNSFDEAKANALKEMQLYYKGDDWQIEKQVE